MSAVDWKSALKRLAGKNHHLYRYILSAGPRGVTPQEVQVKRPWSRAEIIQRLSQLEALNLVKRQGNRYYVPREILEEARFMTRWFMSWHNLVVPITLPMAVFLTAFVIVALVMATAEEFSDFAPPLFGLVLAPIWALTVYAWIKKPKPGRPVRRR